MVKIILGDRRRGVEGGGDIGNSVRKSVEVSFVIV